MNFADKFANFRMWDLVGWCVIVAMWLAWEIWGATHNSAATFTYLIRTTCASFRYGRSCLSFAWVVLGWHFLWYDTRWWRALIAWVKA